MGWGPNTIAEKMAASFTDIAVACMMIGFSRGILVVLQSGHIIDTIVYGISIPLHYFPSWVASEAMLVVQTLLNFLIPSGSGPAVTSMPIMAPLADLVGGSGIPVRRWTFEHCMANRHGTNHVWNRRCKD